MIDRINFKCLCETLSRNHFYRVSYEGFKTHCFKASHLKDTKDFFLQNEDYHLLGAMQDQERFFLDSVIFINIFEDKRAIFKKEDFYTKYEYKEIFDLCSIKISKEFLQQIIKFDNGY